MPSKKSIFTPSSILFRPHHNPAAEAVCVFRRFVVEAPGTAPGSEWFITPPVYCHSRLRGISYIGAPARHEKGQGGPCY